MQTATDAHIAALRAMTSRTDAATYLAKIRGAALNDLARAAGVFGTATQKRQMLVERYVGARINAAAIRAL